MGLWSSTTQIKTNLGSPHTSAQPKPTVRPHSLLLDCTTWQKEMNLRPNSSLHEKDSCTPQGVEAFRSLWTLFSESCTKREKKNLCVKSPPGSSLPLPIQPALVHVSPILGQGTSSPLLGKIYGASYWQKWPKEQSKGIAWDDGVHKSVVESPEANCGFLRHRQWGTHLDRLMIKTEGKYEFSFPES